MLHNVGGCPHLNRMLFLRCRPSASPKKPSLSRACTPSWARHPVPAPTSCPRPQLTGRCPGASVPSKAVSGCSATHGGWVQLGTPSPGPQHLPGVPAHPIFPLPTPSSLSRQEGELRATALAERGGHWGARPAACGGACGGGLPRWNQPAGAAATPPWRLWVLRHLWARPA